METLNLFRTLIVIALAAVTAASANSAQLARCIGGICVGKDAPTFQELQTRVRSGAQTRLGGLDRARSVCVYDATIGVSQVFTFSGDVPLATKRLDGIFVAQGRLCNAENSRRRQRSLPILADIGIQIGDDQGRVDALLGRPTRVHNALLREKQDNRYLNTRYASAYGVTRLHYEEEKPHSLLFNQFGIDSNGRIVSMWINESP